MYIGKMEINWQLPDVTTIFFDNLANYNVIYLQKQGDGSKNWTYSTGIGLRR